MGIVCVSIAGGMASGWIAPLGKDTGEIQFDVLSYLNMDEGFVETVVFARYWVCRDYYAVSIIWTEPHGLGLQDLKTMVVFSDGPLFGWPMSDIRTGFQQTASIRNPWVREARFAMARASMKERRCGLPTRRLSQDACTSTILCR